MDQNFICKPYRGHQIRRDYVWHDFWWAEIGQRKVAFGSSEEIVKQKVDAIVEKRELDRRFRQAHR